MSGIKKIVVYTDGSSSKPIDGKILRYGGTGVYFKENSKYNFSKSYKGDNITNQRMELLACVQAIKMCIRIFKNSKDLWELNIFSDSMYTIKCVTEWAPKWICWGWKRKVGKQMKLIKNVDVIKVLYRLSSMYPVKYFHIHSHQKEPDNKTSSEWKQWKGNDAADKLAHNAMLNYNKEKENKQTKDN